MDLAKDMLLMFFEKGFRKAISFKCLGTSNHALGPENFIERCDRFVLGQGKR